MRDFYATSGSMPLDQADGLRRLFAAGGPRRVIPLVANPYSGFPAVVMERLISALGSAGCHTLVIDAADASPAPHELAQLDLASALEPLGRDVTYLAARGMPRAHVDTRGSAAGWLDAVADAVPQADVVLMHASPPDLARMFQRRPARPLVIGSDHPESIKHAYAGVKLLAKRCGLMTFDLLLVAAPDSPRLSQIVGSLAGCADGFLGCLLHDWAVIDPASTVEAPVTAALHKVVRGQLLLGSAPVASTASSAAAVAARPH